MKKPKKSSPLELVTAAPTPPASAASPATLDLQTVLNHLIESKLPFILSYAPDEKKDRRFKAEIERDEVCIGGDPVTVLLSAIAKGLADMESRMKASRKVIEEREGRVADLKTRLPGVEVHLPDDKGVCSNCGEKHPPNDIGRLVLEGLAAVMSGKPDKIGVVKLDLGGGDDEDKKKDDN